MIEYYCIECQKRIFALTKVEYLIGAEKPPLIHGVCYERLKTFENAVIQENGWVYEDEK